MRKNILVTNKELIGGDQSVIISRTDIKGIIQDANHTFIEVSGYSREELIGKPHNILRHPDMPQWAFRDLWATIKSGKPWTGVVKNRCKNGDHYWVVAYVTPIIINGVITGFTSFRTFASRAQIEAYDALYRKYIDRPPLSYRLSKLTNKFGFKTACVAVAAFTSLEFYQWLLVPRLPGSLHAVATVLGELSALIAVPVCLTRLLIRRSRPLEKALSHVQATGDLTYCFPLDNLEETRELQVSLNAFMLSLRNIVLEFKKDVIDLRKASGDLAAMSSEVEQASTQQSDAVQHVAGALDEILKATQTINQSVHDLISLADVTKNMNEDGTGLVSGAMEEVLKVNDMTDRSAENIKTFLGMAKRIGELASAITDVTKQTDLLALNAAIEAARAGPAGRGFAVVADEVRTLAEHSRTTAADITSLAAQMAQQSEQVGAAVDEQLAALHRVKDSMRQVTDAFMASSSSAMMVSFQIRSVASAAQEQSCGMKQIADNTENVSLEISHNRAATTDVSRLSSELTNLTEALESELARFTT